MGSGPGGSGRLRMKLGLQTTLRDRVTIGGEGVHSAAKARLTLHPADANSGVVFLRTGLPGGRERLIEAKWSNVTQTALCTVIGDASGASVSTIEHLMAALAGLEIDNALIEVDGPEVPVLDGSAARFVEAFDAVGIARLSRPRRSIKIVKPVRVDDGGGWCELRPADRGFHLDVEIDFATPAIGRQRRAFDVDPATFRRDIARARTFGLVSDVKKLWRAGLALGSSLENSVAIHRGAVLNPEGLRYADEYVRHKALDAIGDLALAGAPIVGAYRAYRPGHRLNALALRALFADRSAYQVIETAAKKTYAVGRAALGRAPAPAFAPATD